MKIVGLSVDVDGWDTCLNFYGIRATPEAADREVSCGAGIQRLLSLFKKTSVKATFFIVGNTAKRFKKDVCSIAKDGHEMACHSMIHDNFAVKGKQDIKKDLLKNMNLIERICKSECVGFRAPAFRASNNLLDVLEDLNFKYDSSVNPTYIPGEYGTLFAPFSPYRPSKTSVRKRGERKIIELPVAVNPIIPIPLGAPFIRNFGVWWAKLGLKSLWSLGIPAILYIHPKDVVEIPNNSPVPWYIKRNSGVECLGRMDKIIKFCKKEGAHILTLEKMADLYSKKLLSH